jgi:ATP-binding cassette subfamily B protein
LYLLSLFSAVAFYVCYGGVAIQAARGAISIGDMTLYIAAFRQGQQGIQAILSSIGGMYEDNLYMSNLFEFLSITADSPKTAFRPSRPFEIAAREKGIRFHRVSFRYPDASEWALQDVNIFVPEGRSLSLVGENGAGKTTLLKLLTRLYEPTLGQVMLDGRDIREWESDALSLRIGVIFQDFNRYQFNVCENVGTGSIEHLNDPARVIRALQAAGAWDFVSTLPRGIETQLGRWFSEGVELSGGQWQRIALARAFMQDKADILLLDEPTAALDAAAEHAVFERFRELARGKTAIVISHRFPVVRMADRVLVLDKGRVVEEGTHDELLELGSRYAQLFALQAEGYR